MRKLLLFLFMAGTFFNPINQAAATFYDFESGAQGWTTGADGTTSLGVSTGGLDSWVLGSTLPGTTGVSLGSQWWTNPNYGNLGAERSWVASPLLVAVGSGVNITFDSYSSNEGGYPTSYDVEHIQLSINGSTFFDVHGQVTDLHNLADQIFRTVSFTTLGLTAGDSIQYRFLYDTGDGCCGPTDIEGWAFDNVNINLNAAYLIPEPSTMLLLGFGLLGLARISRRMK